MNLTLLAVVNLLAASASLGNATSIALFSARPKLRRMAGAVAALSFVYVLIFAYRLSNAGVRDLGWLGEAGTVAAPMAFLVVWVWPLWTMDRYVKDEQTAIVQSARAIERAR